METATFLDDALEQTIHPEKQRRLLIDELCRETALDNLVSSIFKLFPLAKTYNREQFRNFLHSVIGEIDQMINRQVNAIIHHSRFQRLESSWRGLLFLLKYTKESDAVKVKILDVSWREVVKDLDRAMEFDQSNLFKKIYSEEYDTPGGEPYGVILGDYYLSHCPTPDMPFDNLSTLRQLSYIAAASFSPFVSSAHPRLFGLENFHGLSQPIDFFASFRQPEYVKWNQFRKTEDARFVGLVVPRILTRTPYRQNNFRHDGFPFKEDVSGRSGENYCWGNACYAFGAVLIQAFNKHHWFADIRGSFQGIDDGGVVSGLQTTYFDTDKAKTIWKISTDILISDTREKFLSEIGVIPLCHSKDTPFAVFYSNQSLQGELSYDKSIARSNARLSGMLQYILCASRFAHFIKVIGRDKVGSFLNAADCEEYLRKWLMNYSVASDTGSYEMRARYPLAESRIEVKEIPGKSGTYGCVVHLRPHTQADQMMSSIKLITELVATQAS